MASRKVALHANHLRPKPTWMPMLSASARRSSMPPRESRPLAMSGSSGCTAWPIMLRTSLITWAVQRGRYH